MDPNLALWVGQHLQSCRDGEQDSHPALTMGKRPRVQLSEKTLIPYYYYFCSVSLYSFFKLKKHSEREKRVRTDRRKQDRADHTLFLVLRQEADLNKGEGRSFELNVIPTFGLILEFMVQNPKAHCEIPLSLTTVFHQDWKFQFLKMSFELWDYYYKWMGHWSYGVWDARSWWRERFDLGCLKAVWDK